MTEVADAFVRLLTAGEKLKAEMFADLMRDLKMTRTPQDKSEPTQAAQRAWKDAGGAPAGSQGPSEANHGDTRELAHWVSEWTGWLCELPSCQELPLLHRLERDLRAVADAGQELPEETLRAARDFLGVLVGR